MHPRKRGGISFIWVLSATIVISDGNLPLTVNSSVGAFRPTIASTTRPRPPRIPHQVVWSSNPKSLNDHRDFLADGDSDSLSHWLSSPERYAGQLGLTTAQVQARKEEHAAASQALHEQLSRLPASEGKLKHQLVCTHRYQYGKHPFVCQHCWSYLPICLCPPLREEPKIALPPAVQRVVLWTHHREWTSISNSGSLLPLLLDDTKLYMKGLPQHDVEFHTLLSNAATTTTESNMVIVLWPDNDTSSSSSSHDGDSDSNNEPHQSKTNRKTWHEVQEMIAQADSATRNITLLAMEGTWRTARRMASKLPSHVIRVALPSEAVYWRQTTFQKNNQSKDTTNQPQPPARSLSLLAQLRQQEGGSQDNLCTAEAVTAALVGLGLSQDDGNRILTLIQTKVDRTRRYQGKLRR